MNIRTYDSKCPLTSVGCVITEENCYSNVQKFEDPSMIDFNLDNPKLWKPLFDNKYFEQNPEMKQIESYQPDIIYFDIRKDTEDLEKQIYKYITTNFEKLRLGINNDRMKKRTTNWNIEAGRKLSQVLMECEMYMFQARQGATNSTLRGDRKNRNENINIDRVNRLIQDVSFVSFNSNSGN